ncbi:MAG: hypothetical protein WAO35_07375 [Terriglobia bacterium]
MKWVAKTEATQLKPPSTKSRAKHTTKIRGTELSIDVIDFPPLLLGVAEHLAGSSKLPFCG